MDNIEQSMPIAVIEEGLTVVRNRIARFERDRAELDKRILADREEERLLSRLAALRRGEPSATLTGDPTHEASIHVSEPARPRESTVVSAVIDELTSAGRPIHISELMRLLQARNVPLPGAGTQANLIVYLRRDPRILRPSRGTYALAEWGLSAIPANRRRRKRKRARASR